MKVPAATPESPSTANEPSPAAVTAPTTALATRSSKRLAKKISVFPLVVNEVTNNRVKRSRNCHGDK